MEENLFATFNLEDDQENLVAQSQGKTPKSESNPSAEPVGAATINLFRAIKNSTFARCGRSISIIVVAFVAIALIGAAVVAMRPCAVTPEERYAIEVVKDYRSMLKDPDSMTIRGDITVVHASYDSGPIDYCYFEVSAKNSFGGFASSVPFYEGEKYQMDVSEEIDESEYNLRDEGDLDEYSLLAVTQFKWAYWQAKGFSERETPVTVDGESVAKALGVSYSE